MEVYKLKITRELYAEMTLDDRLLFIMSGHIANELNILRNLILLVQNGDAQPLGELNKAGVAVQSITLIKLFSVKVKEAYEFINKQGRILRVVKEDADANIAEPLKKLRVYFNEKDNLLARIRDKFGAHYDVKELNNYLSNDISEDSCLYLTNHQGLSLYYIQEQVLFTALTGDTADIAQRQKIFGAIIDDVNEVAAYITDIAQGIMIYIGKKYAKESWMNPPLQESVKLPKYSEIVVPYLVDFSSEAIELKT